MRRAAITGMGVISSAGHSVPQFWDSLLAGRSNFRPPSKLGDFGVRNMLVAQVTGFDESSVLPAHEQKKMDRSTLYVLAAAREAIANANFELFARADSVGISIGSAVGGINCAERETRVYLRRGARYVSPYMSISMFFAAHLGQISIRLGITGETFLSSSGETAGTDAIGYALRAIQDGRMTAMLCGGTDMAVTTIGLKMYASRGVLATGNEQCPATVRPFDLNRSGTLIGDGAALLLLEDLDHARARGAHIYAEVVDYAQTLPLNSGQAHLIGTCATAIRRALTGSSGALRHIDYIQAHGEGSPSGDLVETEAYKAVFGEQTSSIPVTSIKGVIGHTLGAAGAFDTVCAALSISAGTIPPTAGYDKPDSKCDLSYVVGSPRTAQIGSALVTSFSFDGRSSALVLSKCDI